MALGGWAPEIPMRDEALFPYNLTSSTSSLRRWVFSRFVILAMEKQTLGILAHRTSEDEQGVYNHLRNAMYLGSIAILRG